MPSRSSGCAWRVRFFARDRAQRASQCDSSSRSRDRPRRGRTLIVGVPAEVKEGEHRVAITPDGVRELAVAGHRVLIERGAGEDSAITDSEYEAAGADAVSVDDAWGAELVVKVKEPQASEY